MRSRVRSRAALQRGRRRPGPQGGHQARAAEAPKPGIADWLARMQAIELDDIDFASAGDWPMPVRCAATTILVVLLLTTGWIGWLSGQWSDLEALERRESQIEAEFRNRAVLAAPLAVLREERAAIGEQLETALATLPVQTEIPRLLEDIGRAALESTRTRGQSALGDERPTEFCVELPIDRAIHGDYHRLVRLAATLPGLSRLVTTGDFRLVRSATAGAVRLEVTVATCRQRGDTKEDAGEEA